MMALNVLCFVIFLVVGFAKAQDPAAYFGASDNAAYLEWLEGVSYERTQFLPSPSGNSTGAALHWTIRDDQIFFAMAAKATAWIGFGIAEAGGMYGADTVIYTASTDSLMDGHILDERLVFPDDCQSWTLLNSVNDGGFLIFEASRLLDTGDDQDHPIVQDGDPSSVESRVITAWSDLTSTLNHGPNNRAATALRFYGTVEFDFDTQMEQESEGSLVLKAVDHPIKEQDTEYAHFCFSYADMIAQGMPANASLHSIGMEPFVDPRASKYVHHFVLFASMNDGAANDDCEEGIFFEVAYAWAPGEGPQVLPPNVGGPLGEDGFKSFQLQTHYNNPWLDSGVVDSSGVRIHYTSQKREHDLGVMQLGDPIVALRNQTVGPAAHVFDCPSSCSKATLTEPVTVLREALHMHQKGLTMSNDHIRDDQVIRRAEVQYYDFEQQGAYTVQQEPFEILPGDSFKTKCEYLANDTVFGASSQEEMCMVFMSYYPRVSRSLFGFEVPFACGYDLQIPGCGSGYEQTPLASDADLSRSFGTASETCDADGSASGNVGGTETGTTTSGTTSRRTSEVVAVAAILVSIAIGVL